MSMFFADANVETVRNGDKVCNGKRKRVMYLATQKGTVYGCGNS